MLDILFIAQINFPPGTLFFFGDSDIVPPVFTLGSAVNCICGMVRCGRIVAGLSSMFAEGQIIVV
ncbi:hypothetical protein BTHERMOSOX_1108 [Bathymodiolus thermophilus thioautotrophic gill symbiont]|nr:hypothetical protein BTHERMOSOX_1108 [Bathymodiolus thermophilus thioautotrophic gill symbiont]